MNKARYGDYAKLIAFFLVAVLLIIGFGFATEGWWNAPDATIDEEDNNLTGEIQNPSDTLEEPEEPVYVPPEFVNSLTGLEITEELSRKRHFSFVLDSDSPLYGTSMCDIIAEFPTEFDSTRLLAFTNTPEKFSKIGSIAPTRAYISNLSRFFSSVIVYNGIDGVAPSSSCNTSGAAFDMSAHSGYYYTEYTKFAYTNGDLLNAGINNSNINTAVENNASIPYEYVDFRETVKPGNITAKTAVLPFTQRSETELYYQSTNECYSFNKNGTAKNDTLNDKKVTFKNVFILLVDTVTYEEKDSTELVMKTIGSGSGYYITNGYGQAITWESDANGNMTMYDENGEKLIINRGNSYIGIVKSSKSGDIKIS